jgi:ferredoxin
VVRLRGCLAGLGTGTYLALIALGVQEVIVRTDACEACPIGQLYSRIADQTLQAGRLLAALGRSESIAEVHAPRPAAHGKRRVSSADAPALSRRDFLRLGAGTGRALPDWLLKACAENGAKRPSADRRCILAAVNVLAQTTPAPDGLALEGLEFASVSVSREACTACGACAGACPTGALEFVMDEEARSFRLLFRIQDCIDCQVCVHVCQPQAIKVKQSPGFGQVFHSEERTVLASGELARCERCGIDFAAGSGERFCSLCNYRRQHPFGAVLPWAQVREHEVS